MVRLDRARHFRFGCFAHYSPEARMGVQWAERCRDREARPHSTLGRAECGSLIVHRNQRVFPWQRRTVNDEAETYLRSYIDGLGTGSRPQQSEYRGK